MHLPFSGSFSGVSLLALGNKATAKSVHLSTGVTVSSVLKHVYRRETAGSPILFSPLQFEY